MKEIKINDIKSLAHTEWNCSKNIEKNKILRNH